MLPIFKLNNYDKSEWLAVNMTQLIRSLKFLQKILVKTFSKLWQKNTGLCSLLTSIIRQTSRSLISTIMVWLIMNNKEKVKSSCENINNYS